MGERKGTNKYYPPDYDPSKGGLNKFLGTHALRERARKLHLGILIIRFEMPYNIWCDGCGNHIGMGVRYNAEKTKIGMYYSTPVYQFRMKCHLCDNYIEMKTDPGNLDYVIVSGARRQENRWDPTENGQVVPDDKRVIKQLSTDPMFKLEHGVKDKTKMSNVAPTLNKLEELQDRWRDDYMANRMLRDQFRAEKKERKAIEEKDNIFLKKNSLVGLPLLKENEDDNYVASLVRLQPYQSSEDRQKEQRLSIEKKSQFPSSSTVSKKNISQQRSSMGIAFRNNSNSNNTGSKETVTSESFSNSSVSSSTVSETVTTDPEEIEMTNEINHESVLHQSQTSADNVISCSSKTNSPTKSGLSLISCDYDSSSSSSSTS